MVDLRKNVKDVKDVKQRGENVDIVTQEEDELIIYVTFVNTDGIPALSFSYSS